MTDLKNSRIPRQFIWLVVLICVLPFLLNLMGLSFETTKLESTSKIMSRISELSKAELKETMYQSLRGSFSHSLLEWSAFCTAIFTVFLAFMHFKIKGDITTPIIGVALFFAGTMDAFHTLAADRLIEAVADNKNLIPFTWAICRIFNALIMIIGLSIFLIKRSRKPKTDLRFVLITSLIFGGLAYGIIHYCATSSTLPETMFPTSFITRPYDVAPLILFVLAGFFIYRPFHRLKPSLFSHALIISVIPEVATEIHMAFGSTALFDNHFNIAHFLKIIAYLVPLGGLALDYVQTYREEKQAVTQLKEAKKILTHKTEVLTETMNHLERFNQHAVDRELTMIDLKREINNMARKANEPPPYDLSFVNMPEEGKLTL